MPPLAPPVQLPHAGPPPPQASAIPDSIQTTIDSLTTQLNKQQENIAEFMKGINTSIAALKPASPGRFVLYRRLISSHSL